MCHEPRQLEIEFAERWPPDEWRDVHVVLAVSGGADSVAMLRAAVSIKESSGGTGLLHVAHLNHGLRGDEANADQQWLADLCRRLNLPFEAATANVAELARACGDGWEAAARSARYGFLTQTAERLGARWVAVAHTADDQVETVLHRLGRGSGLAGIAGMPTTRPLSPTVSLVRPLLGVWRRDVIAYLETLGQDYRVDASNRDSQFTRNRLRNELLPQLRANLSADVDAALLRLAEQAAEAQAVIAAVVEPLVRECVGTSRESKSAAEPGIKPGDSKRRPADVVRVDCRPLRGSASLVVREVLKAAWKQADWPLQAMGFAEWQRLAEQASGAPNRPAAMLPGGIRVVRHEATLVLERQHG